MGIFRPPAVTTAGNSGNGGGASGSGSGGGGRYCDLSYQYTLSTHPNNAVVLVVVASPYQPTFSTHPINPINAPCFRTLSTPPLIAPYYPTSHQPDE